MIGLQLAQAFIHRRLKVAIGQIVHPDLGGQKDILAGDIRFRQAAPDLGLVFINLRGVDMTIADIQCMTDHADAVGPGDLPCPKTERGNPRPLDFDEFHVGTPENEDLRAFAQAKCRGKT